MSADITLLFLLLTLTSPYLAYKLVLFLAWRMHVATRVKFLGIIDFVRTQNFRESYYLLSGGKKY